MFSRCAAATAACRRFRTLVVVPPDPRRRRRRRDQALPDTVAGRDTAAEIRSGLMRGLSVSFQAARQSFAGGVRRIQSATMTAVAVVDDPSYDAPVEVRARVHERRHRRAWQ